MPDVRAPPDSGALARRCLDVLVLCNDATLGAGDTPGTGDPTEIALLEAARDRGVDPEQRSLQALPRIDEVPFDSARKLMVTVHDEPDGGLAPWSRAPRRRSSRCAPLPVARATGRSGRTARPWLLEGLRVLAAAARLDDPDRAAAPPGGQPHQRSRRTSRCSGVVGMIDPPRAEAPAAVAECRAAGITPVMITGDHPATAAAIARRLGILEAGDDQVLTGPALSQLDDAAARRRTSSHVRVYARVDPEQKIRIVRALQADGQSVAMTGDGVNDAPALRQAEIGVAMGEGGTDVAREAADMVLLDDRFATIVTAVREGRRIYDDIRKFIRYALTGNTGEIWVVFLAPFLGMPVPLLPIHILWVNLITDGLPGLALAEEPAERDVMARPPRPPRREHLRPRPGHPRPVGRAAHRRADPGHPGLGAVRGHRASGSRWCSRSWCSASSCTRWPSGRRPGRCSRMGLLTNPALLGAIALSVVLQLALLYVPWLQDIFRTTALTPAQLARRVRRPPGGPVRGRGREAARAPGRAALRRGHRRARGPTTPWPESPAGLARKRVRGLCRVGQN